MRVLVVDDDQRLAAVIRDSLDEAGIVADAVFDGASALRSASNLAYDVVILDVMLGSGSDGFEVCRRLRERGVGAAVLMLTALDGVPDRVQGLNAGADDYLVKPFAFAELEARLQALVRRGSAERQSWSSGTLHVDGRSRRAYVAGAEIGLTRKEFDILRLLVSRAGAVVSREQIHDAGWDGDELPGPNLVEAYIARLRRKLAAAGATDVITTLRGTGYRLEVVPLAAACV